MMDEFEGVDTFEKIESDNYKNAEDISFGFTRTEIGESFIFEYYQGGMHENN